MDPVQKLSALTEELDTHATRLSARAQELKQRATNGPEPTPSELLMFIAESMQEQVDTGLDFQREQLVTTGEAIAAVDTGGAGDDDAGLFPEDADTILEVLNAHLALLDEMIPNLPPDQAQAIARLQGLRKKAVSAIELVKGLVLEDTEDDEDEDEDEDAADVS